MKPTDEPGSLAPHTMPGQASTGLVAHPLSSGRQLRITPGDDWQGEHLEVVSPEGDVEVEILLTREGPVVRVRAGSLRMSSASSIQLEAAGAVEIRAEELRVRTQKSVHLDGETILLNCADTPPAPAQLPHTHAPDCGHG